MMKPKIHLSKSVVEEIIKILSSGNKAEVDIQRKNKEVVVFEVPRSKLRYKVSLTEENQN